MATTPYPFVASTVLTASQLNSTFNIPVSTKTANYVLTAADAGTRVVMNAAGSTTITVNTSLFSAGDNLEISNIGAGVTTLTAGTATVSSAGPLAIPQYGGGRLVFTSASAAIYFPSAVTVAAPAAAGLTFITTATGTSQSSSDHTGVFSATYNNYLLLIENIQCSLDGYMLSLQYGTGSADTAATYVFSYIDANGANLNASGTAIKLVAADTTATESAAVFATIFSPNLATATGSTSICSARNGDQTAFTTFGSKQTTTQYTSLHFVADAGSTYSFKFTLYGYATSQDYMPTPQKTIHNAITGEIIIRDYNANELAQYEADLAQDKKDRAAQAKSDTAKAAARQAVLDKLGLTADEIAALLG